MIPAYRLPANREEYVVMRCVVKQGFSRDMADLLIADIQKAVAEFDKLEYPTPTRIAMKNNIPMPKKAFNHTGK